MAAYNIGIANSAEHALAGFAAKWEQKYKHAILSWKTNWDNLTSYFDFFAPAGLPETTAPAALVVSSDQQGRSGKS